MTPNKRQSQGCSRIAIELEELIKSVLAFSKPQEYAMEQLDLSVLLQRLIG